jgi:hypothetical protein
VSEKSAFEALCEVPWQASEWYKRRQPEFVCLEIVGDAAASDRGLYERKDLPVTFSQFYRKHTYRSVKSNPVAVKIHNEYASSSMSDGRKSEDLSEVQSSTPTDHDAFSELEE